MRETTGSTGGRTAALIPAAGSGSRMQSAIPKPFLRIGGREILACTLDVFEACDAIHEVWIIAASEHRALCQQSIVSSYGYRKIRGVVTGGATRQESVWRGLQRIEETVEFVVVHDGVRPFVTPALVHETLRQAMLYGAAITAVPVKDTLKRVSAAGEVETTVPRRGLWRTQTPQAFQRALLWMAFQHAWEHGIIATDEAGLLEAYGQRVKVVPGIESNVKVTTPDDLLMCEGLLRARG
jgi:2-C-methyl-D-erythritol 4-phosphate cytidylyltransferase